MLYLRDFPRVMAVFVESEAVDGIEVNPESLGRKEIPDLLLDMFLSAETMLKMQGEATVGTVLGPVIADKISHGLRDRKVRDAPIFEIPDPVNDALKTVLGLGWIDLRQLVSDWKEGELFG